MLQISQWGDISYPIYALSILNVITTQADDSTLLLFKMSNSKEIIGFLAFSWFFVIFKINQSMKPINFKNKISVKVNIIFELDVNSEKLFPGD